MAEQNITTMVEKYDVFSGIIGDTLWDVHSLVEAAIAAGKEENDGVDRVLYVALKRLHEAIKGIDSSQFLYATKEGRVVGCDAQRTLSTIQTMREENDQNEATNDVVQPSGIDQTRRIDIEDSFIRTGMLLQLLDQQVDVHNNSDFDVIDALVKAVKNEVATLERIVFPD